MRRLVPIALLVLLLAGCTTYALPAHVVMLTPAYPDLGRCTGVAMDETHVLTAAHCIGMKRVVTQLGVEATAIAAFEFPQGDIALVELDRRLVMPAYATIAEPVEGVPAQVYGACPYYFSHDVRQALYMGRTWVQMSDGSFRLYDQWATMRRNGDDTNICGGDSGGVVVQDGNVVGVTSAVDALMPLMPMGAIFYTVPPKVIKLVTGGL